MFLLFCIYYVKCKVTWIVTLFLLFFKRICVVDTKSIFHSTGKASCREKEGLTIRNGSTSLKNTCSFNKVDTRQYGMFFTINFQMENKHHLSNNSQNMTINQLKVDHLD